MESSKTQVKNLSIQIDHARRHARTIEIAIKYASGISIEDISADYEISRSQILRIARLNNLPKRPKHFPDDIKEGVLAAHALGKPLSEIAALFGVSQAYVSITAKKAGMVRYKKGTE